MIRADARLQVSGCDKLRMTEVIIGQHCTLSRVAIVRALGPLAGEVKIRNARAAYDRLVNSPEAAEECSPRRKPWGEKREAKRGAPPGRKRVATLAHASYPSMPFNVR